MAWVVSKEGEGVLEGSKRPEAGLALANMGGSHKFSLTTRFRV